jgi:hypothetical protein
MFHNEITTSLSAREHRKLICVLYIDPRGQVYEPSDPTLATQKARHLHIKLHRVS